MAEIFNAIEEGITSPEVRSAIRALAILVGGLVLSSVLSRQLKLTRLRIHQQILARRMVRYTLSVLTLVLAVHQLGIDLSILLGTAGILTVAIGFAAQTSASNFISGLFLMAERPFEIGDSIQLADITGRVVAIDLLSVRIKTFDNLLVRVPNETMIKANVTNLTHFPIRRVDLSLSIGYKEEIEHVTNILSAIARRVPICLEEPKPILIHKGFGDSSVNIQYCVWGTRENFLELRNTMYTEIKKEFAQAGVEIPYPHRTVYTIHSNLTPSSQTEIVD